MSDELKKSKCFNCGEEFETTEENKNSFFCGKECSDIYDQQQFDDDDSDYDEDDEIYGYECIACNCTFDEDEVSPSDSCPVCGAHAIDTLYF